VAPTVEVGAVLGRALERAWLARVPVAVYIVLTALLEMAAVEVNAHSPFIVFALFFVAYIWLYVALLAAAVRTSGGATVGVGALSVALLKVVKVVLLGVMAAVPIVLGLLLLIVPGIMLAMAWALAAVSALIGGVLLGDIEAVSPSLTAFGLLVFPVVILGGLDSVPGTIVGGLIIGLTKNFINGYWDGSYAEVGPYFLLLLILLVRPYGLFGQTRIERV
jgi:hypothetical protein